MGGSTEKKNFKNASKICLHSFLLRFYKSEKHFGGFKTPKHLPLPTVTILDYDYWIDKSPPGEKPINYTHQ